MKRVIPRTHHKNELICSMSFVCGELRVTCVLCKLQQANALILIEVTICFKFVGIAFFLF